MAKKDELPETPTSEVIMTKEIAKSIEDLIFQKKKIAMDQEAFKEALEKVADKAGIKKGLLSKRVNMIIKEEEQGGELKSNENDIIFVEKYFQIKEAQ